MPSMIQLILSALAVLGLLFSFLIALEWWD